MDKPNRGPLSSVILDEIALEGLEGITIPSLWVYLSASLEIPLPLGKPFENQIWSFILSCEKYLLFYVLPIERPVVKLYDRFENLDPFLGVPVQAKECPIPRYKWAPVQDGGVIGSCEFYKEREEIKIEDLIRLRVEDVLEKWGNKFVIVGKQELRYNSLTPDNVPVPKDLTLIQYCLWELIGRSRYNGESTAGNWSLQQFCKDSTFVFYMKSRLMQFGLISCLIFNEKRGDRLHTSTLITLPRFYRMHKSAFTTVIEKLFEVLKDTPKYRIEYSSARKYFPALERLKAFKKIAMTHLFRKIFEVVNISIMEAEDVVSIKERVNKDRQVLVLKLRNPDMLIHNELYADNCELESNQDLSEFHNDKHTFVDMPHLVEFYRTVERFGSRGCSQSEISYYMAAQHVNLRQMVKKGQADGLIRSYVTDCGRQRTNMFVVVQNFGAATEKSSTLISSVNTLKCSDEPNIPEDTTDVPCQDVPTISGKIKLITGEVEMSRRESTLRQAQRKELIIQTINERCFMSVIQMRSLIFKNEKEKGFKDEVCRKSVRRILTQLSQLDIVKLYEITLQAQETIRTYRYITHPKIDADHKVLHMEMLRLKNAFFLTLEDQRFRSINRLEREKIEPPKVKKRAAQKEQKELMLSFANHQSPKFLLARCLHEFLFFLCYEQRRYEPVPITEELLRHWQLTEPNLAITNYIELLKEDNKEDNIKAYTRDLNWRTFVPPLPQYPDKPAGWVLLVDSLVERIPLSLFNKIFRLDKSPEVNASEFLNHPIRQHYLVKHLPCNIQSQITRTKLTNLYTRITKLLNHMGLLQVGPRQQKDQLMIWLYINKHAEILDTTITDPNYMSINPNLNYTALRFTFECLDDVHQYWTTLNRICMHTRLGYRKVSKPIRRNKRLPHINFLNPVDFSEAAVKDVRPQVPGDRLGAGGLSTNLFGHAFRNWSWALPSECKSKFLRMPKNKLTRSLLPKIIIQNRKSKVSVVPLKRLQMKTTSGSLKRQIKMSSLPKRKATQRDAIDRDALKNMRTLRVSWNDEEDEILKMARTVYMYILAPIPLLNFLTIGKICRDIMRRNLGSFNKTAQACLRRSSFMVKNNRHLPQVPIWLHQLQTNEEMKSKYGEKFFKILKKAYFNRQELSNAVMVHFVLVLLFLYKQVKNYETIDQPKFVLPDTIAEFKKKLKICEPVPKETCLSYENPHIAIDIQMAVIRSVLHSSLCCSRDKTTYNLQALEIYKNFGEDVLQQAFQRARNDGLVIAIQRKHIKTIPSQITAPTYKLSQRYQTDIVYLRIPYGVFDRFFEFFMKTNETIFGANPIKTSLELKSPNPGQMYFIAENLIKQRWQIDVKLPSSIMTIDDTQQESMSSFDRIIDHYHTIFENAPETEYIKQISEEEEKQSRIKFQHANLSYKVYYTPFDVISKMPTRRLHFFCALDHLQQEVEINFNKLQHKDDESNILVIECPFNCIMRNANYINAIERIVQEKKQALRELQEIETPQHLLNLAVGVNTITVLPTNLLTLVRMLESFWLEKELQLERKDLGRIVTRLKTTKTIDWQELCNDILAYKSTDEEPLLNDEYEPTLSKDDRLYRAHDVFVVNLPTLVLTMNSEVQNNKDVIQYEGLPIPKMLLASGIQTEEILQKVKDESYWKYTENTFETLRPTLQELSFNAMEIQHLEEIHNYIKSFNLGVPVADLMREFPYDEFLIRALKTLTKHYLTKRVGISTFMYVHKVHIRNWVVHTFHIKRLDREQLKPTKTTKKRKRNLNDAIRNNEDREDEEKIIKKFKRTLPVEQDEKNFAENDTLVVNDIMLEKKNEPESEELKKRKTKQPILYANNVISSVEKSNVKKDIVVMKPKPWIRLNGSVNRRVLDRWMGSILTECIALTGCFVDKIVARFSYMFPVDVMFLIELLRDLKCIKLRQIQCAKVGLFSEYEEIKESDATELFYPEDTFVIAEPDALSKLAIFIGKKKYSAEFI